MFQCRRILSGINSFVDLELLMYILLKEWATRWACVVCNGRARTFEHAQIALKWHSTMNQAIEQSPFTRREAII